MIIANFFPKSGMLYVGLIDEDGELGSLIEGVFVRHDASEQELDAVLESLGFGHTDSWYDPYPHSCGVLEAEVQVLP